MTNFEQAMREYERTRMDSERNERLFLATEQFYEMLKDNVKMNFPDDKSAQWEILQNIQQRLYDEGFTYDIPDEKLHAIAAALSSGTDQ